MQLASSLSGDSYSAVVEPANYFSCQQQAMMQLFFTYEVTPSLLNVWLLPILIILSKLKAQIISALPVRHGYRANFVSLHQRQPIAWQL